MRPHVQALSQCLEQPECLRFSRDGFRKRSNKSPSSPAWAAALPGSTETELPCSCNNLQIHVVDQYMGQSHEPDTSPLLFHSSIRQSQPPLKLASSHPPIVSAVRLKAPSDVRREFAENFLRHAQANHNT